MELHLGRRLRESERVHHINGLKWDNRIENLFLCTHRSSHLRAHRSLEELLPVLVGSGIVIFNRVKGIYQLCETRN